MTQQEIILQIQQFIVANGNNEITANVLRPILENMVSQPNSLIGDLNGLNTSVKTTLVAAINQVLSSNSTTVIKIHTGTIDPNVQPPLNYNFGDFYRFTVNGSTAGLYIFNGLEWVLQANSDASVYNGMKTTTGAYTFTDEDCTVVYNGTVDRSWVIPSSSSNYGREIRIVNRSANTITLSANYFDASGSNGINTVAGGAVVHLQSAGNLWYKIN